MASCPSCRRGVPDVAIYCPRCGQRCSDWPEITNDPASISPPPPLPGARPLVPPPLAPGVYPHLPPLPRSGYHPMPSPKSGLSVPATIIIVIAAIIMMAMCFGVMVG